MNNKKHILVITGPTASGKSDIAMLIAQSMQGHILCMDSMQIYRGMNVGTAKPTERDQRLVPHHLLDIVEPVEEFSAAQYRDICIPLLEKIPFPVLVGGTGLYLNAVSRNMDFGRIKSDDAVRQKYQDLSDTIGHEALWQKLFSIDPDAAGKLHPNDTRRVIRALEVYELTGVPFSKQQPRDNTSDSPYTFHIYSLQTDREHLYERINKRVDFMMKNGLPEEVQSLIRSGVPRDAQSMQGIGYKELYDVHLGILSVNNAVDLIKQRSRNYAKRQMIWFRHDERVCFVNTESKTAPLLAETILAHFTQTVMNAKDEQP